MFFTLLGVELFAQIIHFDVLDRFSPLNLELKRMGLDPEPARAALTRHRRVDSLAVYEPALASRVFYSETIRTSSGAKVTVVSSPR